MTGLVARFVEALAFGRTRARRGKVLAEALGVSDRAVRSLAHDATKAGVLVCADNAGYYVGTPEEVRETVHRLRSQAFEMLSRASQLERAAGLADRKASPAPLPLFEERSA